MQITTTSCIRILSHFCWSMQAASRRSGRASPGERLQLHRTILVAHVCDNWRISSVLLASSLLDKPVISVRPCIPRAKDRSKKRAVVGRKTSTSSLAFRYGTGCAFTQAQGLRVQSCRLDFLSTARRYRPGEGFRFCSYPELMWLHRLEVWPAIVLGALCVLIWL
jgi:hypothetical protein